jgi:hypothetical protein
LIQSAVTWVAANPALAIAGGAVLLAGGASLTHTVVGGEADREKDLDLGMPPADPVLGESK